MIKKSFPAVFRGQKLLSVDAEAGVIRSVVILQEGKDKVGDIFDRKSLDQLVALGNAQGQGVKARNGHPNMCDSSLGAFIGRYKNFSVSSNEDGRGVVIADLHLDESARKSPKGNSFEYILEMAQKNSDMFGNSIVYNPDEPEFKEESDDAGNKIRVPYERFKSFVASDLVDSPAATTSLFKDDTNFAEVATQFLDENPNIFEVLEKNEGVFNQFLAKYKAYKTQKETIMKEKNQNKTFLQKLKAFINSEEGEATTEAVVKTMHNTQDGRKINIEGEVAQGSLVTDEAGQPIANAVDLTLENGTKINTGADGKITSVTAATQNPPAAAPPAQNSDAGKAATEENARLKAEVEGLKKEKSDLEKKISDLETEYKTEQDGIMAEVQKLKDKVTELGKSVQSKHQPNRGGTNFQRRSTAGGQAEGNRIREAFPESFKDN